MGLQSAMTTALTGMQAAETTIDVVGNNVANSNTVGFKESSVLFSTQFLQTQSIGSAPSDSRGGTNPRQIGLGTKVAAINPDFTQGTIEISSNPLDVAIQGDGFLMVQGAQGERLYTRNGQLQTNANNEVVTVTGNRVLGYGVDEDFNIVETLVPLQIPLGAETVAQATQNAFFQGVLSPTADVGDTPSVILSEMLGTDTLEFPVNDSSGGTNPFDVSDFQAVSPPIATASSGVSSGGGSLAAGDYEYRVVWYVNSGANSYESAPSSPISVTGVSLNDQIDLSNLPEDTSPSPIWDGRRIYRTFNGGPSELLDTLPLTGTTYNDDGTTVPTGTLDADALSLTNYSYYVTFVGSGVESRPTSLIGPLAVGSTDTRIRIDNLPQPSLGSGFDSVRIYRNTATSASDFYEVATLPLGETTFIDNVPDATVEATGQQIDLIGPKATASTLLTDVVIRDGSTYSTPFEEGVLSFAGKKGDRTLAAKQLTIDASTTVQDLITFMDQSFGIDNPTDDPFTTTPGGVITPNGQIEFTANMGIANRLTVPLSGLSLVPASGGSKKTISIGFDETQQANGAGSTTDFVVFDSLGIPLNVRITTVMEAKTSDDRTYRWFATSEDNEPIDDVDTVLGNGTITFDSNGRVTDGATTTIAVDRTTTGSQSPLEFTLDFSQVSGLAVSNNLGESVSALNMTLQDGFPPGSLTSFIVTESGLIRGVFSNGTERPLGQMRMARFANSTGLQQVGDNMFIKGINSGEPLEGNPGDQGLGALTAGAVELSNTDIGQNLIELILASTQYRGGTRVITAAQQLLDELMTLRR